MSYRAAGALQAALHAGLSGHPGLAGVPILDAMPSGGGTGTYLLIGPELVLDRSDGSGAGAEHRLVISVISDAAGFLAAKGVAAEVSEALEGIGPDLGAGRLVALSFERAVARRLEAGMVRRIDLSFRARIEL